MESPATMMLGPAFDVLRGKDRAGTREIPAKCDCCMSENALDFEIELPGVHKDNITVKIDGDCLVVRGKRFMRTGERVTKIAVESLDQLDELGGLADNDRRGERKPESKKEKIISAQGIKKMAKKETKKEDKSSELPDDKQWQTDAAAEVRTDTKPENAVSEVRRAIVYVFESHLGYSSDLDEIKVIRYMDGVMKLQVPMKSTKPSRTIKF